MSQLLLDQEFKTSLHTRLMNLRGAANRVPDASIVIPVNAENDLNNVMQILSTIGEYSGTHTFETILVVNNYPPEKPPSQIREFQELGLIVVAVPYVERRGGVAIAARILGVRVAKSEKIISFDSDCTLMNVTDLLDWYVKQFGDGCDLAYTHVDYNELPQTISMRLHMIFHHATRWFRRNILRMPTSRGSNYAIRRTLILDLFDQGKLPYDINVGPVVKSVDGKITYSGAKKLMVYTSGRFFKGTREELTKYWFWRLGYYWRVFILNRIPAKSSGNESARLPVVEPEQPRYRAWLVFIGLALMLGGVIGVFVVELGNPAYILFGLAGLVVFIGAIIWVEFGLYFLVLSTYIRLSDVIIQYHNGPSVAKSLVVLMFVAILIRWAVFNERPTSWHTATLFIGIYGLVGFSSLLYAPNTLRVMAALDNYYKDAIIAIIVVILLQNAKSFRRVIWTLLAAGIFMGSISIYQYFTKTFLNEYWGFALANFEQIVGETNDYRIGGPIGDPNFFAQIMLVLVPIALERMLHEKSRTLKVLAGLAFGLSILSVVLTFSRGGFLAMSVTLAVMLFFYPPRYQTLPYFLIFAVVIMMLIPPTYYNRVFSLQEVLSASNSGFRSKDLAIQGRASEGLTALAMFESHPFIGVGLHNYATLYQEYAKSIGLAPSASDRSAHDLYLEILAETGILGLSAFLIMVFAGGRTVMNARAALLKVGLTENAALVLSFGIGFFGYMIAAIFVHAAFPRYFYLLIGIAFSLKKVAENEIALHSPKRIKA